jgi:hypothetical protein
MDVFECRGGKRSKVSPRGALNLAVAERVRTLMILRECVLFIGNLNTAVNTPARGRMSECKTWGDVFSFNSFRKQARVFDR